MTFSNTEIQFMHSNDIEMKLIQAEQISTNSILLFDQSDQISFIHYENELLRQNFAIV